MPMQKGCMIITSKTSELWLGLILPSLSSCRSKLDAFFIFLGFEICVANLRRASAREGLAAVSLSDSALEHAKLEQGSGGRTLEEHNSCTLSNPPTNLTRFAGRSAGSASVASVISFAVLTTASALIGAVGAYHLCEELLMDRLPFRQTAAIL